MNRKRGALDGFTRSEDERYAFAEESALAHVSLSLADLIEASGVSQRQLAEALGLTEARISQILDVDSNLTVRTIARIACALGQRMQIQFAPRVEASIDNSEPYPSCGSGTWEAVEEPEQVIADCDGLAA
jgi:transcriptional regulator with XRE-family HTH domain